MKNIMKLAICLVAVAAIAITVQPAQAKNTVNVLTNIPFKKGVRIKDAIRKECNLGGKLSEFIQSSAKKNKMSVDRVEKLSKVGAKTNLEIVISNATGGGGGAWSGAKSVSIEGKLYKNGKVIGDFEGKRTSGGGAFSGFKSTCAILGRCVKALGKDVSTWLEDPAKGSLIGE